MESIWPVTNETSGFVTNYDKLYQPATLLEGLRFGQIIRPLPIQNLTEFPLKSTNTSTSCSSVALSQAEGFKTPPHVCYCELQTCHRWLRVNWKLKKYEEVPQPRSEVSRTINVLGYGKWSYNAQLINFCLNSLREILPKFSKSHNCTVLLMNSWYNRVGSRNWLLMK